MATSAIVNPPTVVTLRHSTEKKREKKCQPRVLASRRLRLLSVVPTLTSNPIPSSSPSRQPPDPRPLTSATRLPQATPAHHVISPLLHPVPSSLPSHPSHLPQTPLLIHGPIQIPLSTIPFVLAPSPPPCSPVRSPTTTSPPISSSTAALSAPALPLVPA